MNKNLFKEEQEEKYFKVGELIDVLDESGEWLIGKIESIEDEYYFDYNLLFNKDEKLKRKNI